MTIQMLTGVPMFPLRRFYLFPGAVAPLHVFEPRYRQMVADLLDRAGRLVMATLLPAPGGETGAGAGISPRTSAGGPPVLPIGGLGEILRHDRLPDGRYVIWLLGLGRVRISEVPSDRLYRRVDAEPLPDIQGDAGLARRLRPLLQEAILARTPHIVELGDETPIGLLADILAQCLQLTPAQLEEIFVEQDANRRAERVLGWHLEQEGE